METQHISIISWDVYNKNTGVMYIENEEDIPDTCEENIHFWITFNGIPPRPDDFCLCGDLGHRYG
jgi:hypothetical protein